MKMGSEQGMESMDVAVDTWEILLRLELEFSEAGRIVREGSYTRGRNQKRLYAAVFSRRAS